MDPFRRAITYLRVSVTDRCDFRCVYCMSEKMKFLPKKELLTLEELDRLCTAFITLGVRKLRITGGEPLVRRGIMEYFESISRHLESGMLDELTLTTNGSQLRNSPAASNRAASTESMSPWTRWTRKKFAMVTRWGRLPQVLDGIEAALETGLEVKINTVALKGSMRTKSARSWTSARRAE